MKQLVLFSILSLSSCAFNKPESHPAASPAKSRFELTVDWTNIGETRSGANLKAKRTLEFANGIYVSAEPVTLPVEVPEKVVLKGTVDAQLVGPIDFVKASIKFNDRQVSLPVQLALVTEHGANKALTFEVSGLNNAFKTDRSSWGILSIEVFGRTARYASLEASLRTPPAAVRSEEITLADFLTQEQGGDFDFVSPAVLGTQLSLVRVLKITNDEAVEVHVQSALSPRGSITQWERHHSFRQDQCSFAYNYSDAYTPLSAQLLFLPIDGRFLEQAELALREGGESLALSNSLKKSEGILFGLYGVGGGAKTWSKNGPLGSEVQKVRAVSGCGQRCKVRMCEPTPGSGGGRYGLSGCTCEAWESTQVFSEVSVGVERGQVHLAFEPNGNLLTARYADLDPNKDGETRQIRFASEKSVLLR